MEMTFSMAYEISSNVYRQILKILCRFVDKAEGL